MSAPAGALVAHTDGACHGNPGPGGWGVVFQTPSGVVEISGGSPATTNNQMEMQAVLQALVYAARHFPRAPLHVRTDSRYVLDAITKWRRGWEKKGWKTAAGKPVKNADLWREIFAHVDAHGPNLEFSWVRGHAGDPGNEWADRLALEGLQQTLQHARTRPSGPFHWSRGPS